MSSEAGYSIRQQGRSTIQTGPEFVAPKKAAGGREPKPANQPDTNSLVTRLERDLRCANHAVEEQLGRARRAEARIAELTAENEALTQWRGLARQFDHQRMAALGYLKAVAAGDDMLDGIRAFLAAAPLSGDEVVEELAKAKSRIAELAADRNDWMRACNLGVKEKLAAELAQRDALIHGIGVMHGGKRVSPAEFFKPGAQGGDDFNAGVRVALEAAARLAEQGTMSVDGGQARVEILSLADDLLRPEPAPEPVKVSSALDELGRAFDRIVGSLRSQSVSMKRDIAMVGAAVAVIRQVAVPTCAAQASAAPEPL